MTIFWVPFFSLPCFALNLLALVATLPKSSATGEYFTTKANPERHGLGLQSARRIAQQHDGCLLTELKGSCFRATAMLSTEIRSGS